MEEKSIHRHFSELKLNLSNHDENNNLSSENTTARKTPRSFLVGNEKFSSDIPESSGSTPTARSTEIDSSSKHTEKNEKVQLEVTPIAKQPSSASISSYPSCIFVASDSFTCQPEEDETESSTTADQYLTNGNFAFVFLLLQQLLKTLMK